jgi:engulfment/cell motility protein 1
MLLNQQPITADTNKLVSFIGNYGLKIRLLNVRFEDLGLEEPVLPSREGLDDEYYCECLSFDSHRMCTDRVPDEIAGA